MVANRLIKNEQKTLQPWVSTPLTAEYIPPGNGNAGDSNTRFATITVLKGGPMYFDATENKVPSTNGRPAVVGAELDVIGSEDLRLCRLLATEVTLLDIDYFGGGDQVA